MTRRKFLRALKAIWMKDGELDVPLSLEDLLDDAATLGLDGASDAYVASLALDIDPATGVVRVP